MPVIHFGMGFTERKLPLDDHPILHEQSVDKAGLVSFLEGFYGYLPPAERQDYLRVEQFRQLLRDDLAEHPNAFYRASFEADPLATAEHVLSLRDELIEAGYKLMHPVPANCPDRLKTLHRLEEALLANEPSKKWPLGMADRVYRLIGGLEPGKHPALWVRLHEPLALLDPGSQRLLKTLSDCDDFVQYLPSPNFPEEDTDLARWQRSGWTVRESDPSDFVSPADTEPKESFIRRWASEGQRQIASWKEESLAPTNAQSIDSQKNKLQNDGSLILIKAARDTHISAYLAKLKRLNPDWKPAVLMAKKRQTLDLSFRMEGLPNIGVPSTSLARPSLQVLKLVPTFLWEPVDLRKLHEFLKLIVKPLDRRLGYRLAAALSDSPGLFSEAWFQATTQFFDQELPRLAKRDSRIEPETIESEYNFWFRRTRYPIEGRAPKSEVRKLFVFLVNWVKSRLDEDSDDAIGLNTLAAQAKRAVDLIDQVDEDEFSPLQVDRIVRTVYEAAPANFHAEQQHSLPAAFYPAAICGEISELIWWDFVQEEADYFFSNWFQNELDYLTSQSVHLLSPSAKNQRQIWSRTRPLLFTKDRLVLCIPDRISGTEVSAHPLLGELEALFGDQLDSICMHIDKDGDPSFLDWPSPEFSITDLNPLDPPVPFITIGSPEHMHERPYESPSSLERFLYHPHQWAFQYGLLIKPSRQPELRLGTRLRGLLSHRFMERIFEDHRPLKEWTQASVNRWVVQQEPDILRREGGLFLEYGYEPDRVQFRRQVQRAAWSLICSLRDNGWERLQSEIDLEGQIGELTLKARADLIAHHANGNIAVIDLKWRGKTRFKNLIRNREEIQLNVYAQLLDKQETSELYTAYYLLSDAQILARTNRAFTNAEAVDAEADPMEVRAEILEKLLNTYRWRKSQLASGQLEIRCSKTLNELEDAYQELDYDLLLEMKDTDAPFDDYRALIGLVQ